MARQKQKENKQLSAKNYMQYFWNLSQSVTSSEITPQTVNAACNAGRNIIKMANLVQRGETQNTFNKALKG